MAKDNTKPDKPGMFDSIVAKREYRNKNAAINRPPEEIELRERPDRVKKYLLKHMDKFIFDEFSTAYMVDQKIDSFMKGVPVPLRKEDVKAFNSEKGLNLVTITENMSWVMGIDPKFEHTQNYIDFFNHYFKVKVVDSLTKEGKNEGERENLDSACIHFRAALCFKPDDLAAMYGYARSCRALYMEGGTSEYVGDFKAESIDYFELLTEIHPKFAEAHYYLGYAYLNLGLYQKAQLVWQDFVKKTKNFKDKKEIENRLKQLVIPLEIEKGYNSVLAQRWQDGIDILEPYLQSNYKDWWPLHYYLGVAYISTERRRDAVISFENALRLNPSHIESMEELAQIYHAEGNKDMFEKYDKKAQLLKAGGYNDSQDDTSDAGGAEGKVDEGKIEIKKLPKKTEKEPVVKRIKRLDKKD